MRADALRRREALIDSAVVLFIEHGRAVTLEAIAAHAGVGIATLYRNFSDKDALLYAAAARRSWDFLAIQERITAEFRELSTHNPTDTQRACSLVQEYAHAIISSGILVAAETLIPANLAELPEELEEIRSRIASSGAELVDAAHQVGAIGPGVRHLELFVGVLAIYRNRRVDLESLAPELPQQLLDIFLAGIRVGTAPAAGQ